MSHKSECSGKRHGQDALLSAMREIRTMFTPDTFLAALDVRKTMTRRVMVPQPVDIDDVGPYWQEEVQSGIGLTWNQRKYIRCSHSPGDVILPVTTWATWPEYDHLKPLDLPDDAVIFMPHFTAPDWGCKNWGGKKRPGRFLPKKLWHKLYRWPVTAVRAERVQEISDELYRASFRTLWNSINAQRGYGWDVNPWVWVIEFEVKR